MNVAITMLTEMTRKKILNGQLEDKWSHLHGTPEGYPFVLYKRDKITVYVNAWKEGITDLSGPIEFIKSLSVEGIKNLEAYQEGYSLVVTYSGPIRFVQSVNGLFEPLFAYLKKNGYVGCCGKCGKLMDGTEPVEYYNVNNYGMYLCRSCANRVENELKEHRAEKQAESSNLLMGIIGAVVGALAGVAVWLLIAQLGYIHAISGFIMAFCALYGYERLGGALDKKGIITCIIIMILMVWFANRMTFVIIAYKTLKTHGFTFSEVSKRISEIIKVSELTRTYYGQLAIGYLLTGLGSFGIIIRKAREGTGSYIFKK